MAVEINVDETPAVAVEEEEITWQSVLSEIRNVIQSELSSQRELFQLELSNLRQLCSEQNQMIVSLTGQITDANRTMMERLTQPASQPIAVVLETPAEPVESVEEGNQVVETEQVETVPPARRKRLTL